MVVWGEEGNRRPFLANGQAQSQEVSSRLPKKDRRGRGPGQEAQAQAQAAGDFYTHVMQSLDLPPWSTGLFLAAAAALDFKQDLGPSHSIIPTLLVLNLRQDARHCPRKGTSIKRWTA